MFTAYCLIVAFSASMVIVLTGLRLHDWGRAAAQFGFSIELEALIEDLTRPLSLPPAVGIGSYKSRKAAPAARTWWQRLG